MDLPHYIKKTKKSFAWSELVRKYAWLVKEFEESPIKLQNIGRQQTYEINWENENISIKEPIKLEVLWN